MLAVPTFKFPYKVAIKVAKAEKLVASKKDNKKKLNTKFRVVVLGGKKKESSDLTESLDGHPSWDFNCVVKIPHGKADPVCLLVEDSEGHHKGQVIIPLVKIGPKPYTYTADQTPATSTNLICSELEPTNKCSIPAGFLIYWIWVEEYRSDDDTVSRGSFNKSMTSLFGSRNALGSSKSRISVPGGSISNVSSVSSLNKPEKHKKTSSFFHIKTKKDKSKKTTSDYKHSPESSDVESHMEPGNPFETNINRNVSPHNSKVNSFGSSDFTFGNPTKSYNPLPDKMDILSHGSHGSISESGSYNKYGDEYNPTNYSINPITLPPVNSNLSDRQGSIKQSSNTMPLTLLNKSSEGNFPNAHSTQDGHQKFDAGSPCQEADYRYQPGHRSMTGSDYSIFSDRSITQLPSATIKSLNDEADLLRKENTELKSLTSKSNERIWELQKELECVKDALFRLRSRLLEEGATKFLEKI